MIRPLSFAPRRIAERDWRDEGGFEVRSSRFSELRTPNFELRVAPFSHVSHFTRHSPWLLAGFFGILLEAPIYQVLHQ